MGGKRFGGFVADQLISALLPSSSDIEMSAHSDRTEAWGPRRKVLSPRPEHPFDGSVLTTVPVRLARPRHVAPTYLPGPRRMACDVQR